MLAIADVNVVIPMHGMAQSLNVSVATALILYEAGRQQDEAKMLRFQWKIGFIEM